MLYHAHQFNPRNTAPLPMLAKYERTLKQWKSFQTETLIFMFMFIWFSKCPYRMPFMFYYQIYKKMH